jgi:hypothetical protein
MLAFLNIALHDLLREYETTATPMGYSAHPACTNCSIIPSKRILKDGVFDVRGDMDILLKLGP